MRHSRFPLARRIVDPQPPDSVRRIRRQPDARDEAWRRRFAMEPTFAAAKPGRGHRALASLYKAGKIPAIITQNIDNLHQASGFKADDVVELHGNTTYARCIGCGQAYDLPWVKRASTRPAARPTAHLRRAGQDRDHLVRTGDAGRRDAPRHRTGQQCDLFLAIGSSLVVWPAAGFPLMAKNCGARLVIINNEPTEQDDVADLVIRHDIGETLGPFVGN
jgi:NAD-dependent deacetylase